MVRTPRSTLSRRVFCLWSLRTAQSCSSTWETGGTTMVRGRCYTFTLAPPVICLHTCACGGNQQRVPRLSGMERRHVLAQTDSMQINLV